MLRIVSTGPATKKKIAAVIIVFDPYYFLF